jgi:hypothetical protein
MDPPGAGRLQSSRSTDTRFRLPDGLHVLVPVADLAHRVGQIRAKLRGPAHERSGLPRETTYVEIALTPTAIKT